MNMPSRITDPKQILARGSANTLRKPAAIEATLNGPVAGLSGMRRNARNAVTVIDQREQAEHHEHAAPAEHVADHA